MSAGNVVYGIQASPTLCAAFRENFPPARVVCESVDESKFFGRTFDGVIACGLVFLLSQDSQPRLFERIAAVLAPRGRFLFTAPAEECSWVDVLTGRTAQSLGKNTYEATAEAAGLALARCRSDEGENHCYDVVKPPAAIAV
jgi:hypothetical protein